jgi:large subunit ribosomal protein L32
MRKSGNNRPTVQACANCGAPRVPHRVCMSCGQYGGQQIVAKKAAEE